jgi:hypothetical protein
VVPTRYGRQAILDEFGGLKMCNTSASIDSNRVVGCKVLLFCVYSELAAELCIAGFVYHKSVVHIFMSKRFIIHSRFCYMVKPHEQLVLVSSTHRCASTPNLSTS